MRFTAFVVTLCGSLLNISLVNVSPGQVKPAPSLSPTKLEAFALQPNAQITWSREVGQIESSEAGAIVTALIVEDAAQPRRRMYQVNSLLMSYQETVRNFLGIVVHRGVVERLYAFPDKSWSWDDGLPPPFRLSVGSLNLERNLRCHVYLSASGPVCGPAKQGALYPAEGLTQVQYLYLMETRWVKPISVSVTKGNLGLKKVDVLQTRFENKRIDYFLDRKTHLPARVALFYGGSDRALTIDLSEYVTVSGIQMPGKQKRGKISFQINPLYDEGIFTRPPSIEAGPKA